MFFAGSTRNIHAAVQEAHQALFTLPQSKNNGRQSPPHGLNGMFSSSLCYGNIWIIKSFLWFKAGYSEDNRNKNLPKVFKNFSFSLMMILL